MPPEMSVEPVPLPASGESEPFSQENPALSPGVEMASAARDACGAGAPAGHGGKCTIFARKSGTVPPGVATGSLSVGGGWGCVGGGWRGSVECDVEAADVFALSSGLDDDHVLTV